MYLPQYLSIYLQTAADQTPLRVWLLEQLAWDLAEVVDEAHRGSLLQGILDAATGRACYFFFSPKRDNACLRIDAHMLTQQRQRQARGVGWRGVIRLPKISEVQYLVEGMKLPYKKTACESVQCLRRYRHGNASPRPATHTQFCLLFYERLRSLARN